MLTEDNNKSLSSPWFLYYDLLTIKSGINCRWYNLLSGDINLWAKYLITKQHWDMFKNKFFSKNNELNRKFIKGLNKLSEQSDKL